MRSHQPDSHPNVDDIDIMTEAERLRARRRELDRKRRQEMSEEQRDAYLARRRQNYRRRTTNSLNDRTENAGAHHLFSNESQTVTGTSRFTPLSHSQFNQSRNTSTFCEGSTSGVNNGYANGLATNHPINTTENTNTSRTLHRNLRQQSASQMQNENNDGNSSGEPTDDEDNESGTNYHIVRDTRNLHNIAREFNEVQGCPVLQLCQPNICRYCQAIRFEGETRNFCCKGGKILLPAIPIPNELRDLFTGTTTVSSTFRNNIRPYNQVFSFTSLGVSLDQQITNAPGVPTFRAHGTIHYTIGSLLPNPGCRPRYLQMFIYDTEHETENRLRESSRVRRDVVEKIQRILHAHNPFVQTFRQIGQRSDLTHCKLLIKERPPEDRQYVVPSASQVAAVIPANEDLPFATNRDIVVETTGGRLLNLKEFSGFYDPLQYPLFLPYGTYGWDAKTRSIHGTHVTCCDYYSYMLQIRTNPSILLYGGRLFQQYVVDNYVKIETQRLNYIRTHQDDIRAELYQGLQDCLYAGETDAANVGRRTVLPSSFVGCPRDMYQRYQDAMALVRKLGKPDLFLTMTCNPNWKEIQEQLLPGQTAHERPDLLTRIFRAKYEKLKKFIYKRGVLGRVIGHVHVIEFQKCGLPHVHMLVILAEADKLTTPDDYDRVVSAEIPIKEEQPRLYEAVLKHMIHGPCGTMNSYAPCMKDATSCKKNYPKQFQPCTLQGADSYPVYRRRDDNRYIPLDSEGSKVIDNRWVVPYNPWLLLKFDCHINVEICSSIKSIKYLYKYVHKGPDCTDLEVRGGQNYDEIYKYVDGRWICPPEALWRIYKFPLSQIYPSVIRLQLHIPNGHRVRFRNGQQITDVLDDPRNNQTMLTEFFKVYEQGREPIKYLYTEFPEHYWWSQQEKTWYKRISPQKVIGRLYAALPSDGEKFYERMLLNHVRGPKSFDDLKTIDGVHYDTFKVAAEKLGILEEDDSIRNCLQEAREVRMPSALRRLFTTILIYCEPTGVRRLWDENYSYMIEDYQGSSATNNLWLQDRLLHDIDSILRLHNRRLQEFDLPRITSEYQHIGQPSNLIDQERRATVSGDDLSAVAKLNSAQMLAFTTISNAISTKQSAIFFVDGPGGTGKTFLYRALLASFRKDGHIVLATATSGIAANQLPGGRTAHSRLKIPPKLDSQSYCLFSKQSDMCHLLRQASAIIWDEAPMANKNAIETVDRTFRDMLDVDLPFGGKVMIFGGDFRQVVPVVVGGTRTQTVQSSIVYSHLWTHVKVLKLVENIRAQQDPDYSNFVLRVGNGDEPVVNDDMIKIPNSMVIPWEDESSINQLIESIFPDLENNLHNAEYMMDRAIITPLNDDVNTLNDSIIGAFQGGDEVTYYSFDSVAEDDHNLFLPEFLNSLSAGNLPPHKLTLKKGCPIMCLRNFDPRIGLCNGTRLMCHNFGRYFIDAEILSGEFKGTRVFLPRLPLQTSEDAKLPFKMTRKQFPVRLSFALTINKSQGQTIPHVGIYLPDHVFSHGQLYVALSRGVCQLTTKVLVRQGMVPAHEGVFTRNVVYQELFHKALESELRHQ